MTTICPICVVEFKTIPSAIERGRTRCSMKCGREAQRRARIVHGMSYTRTYRIWRHMWSRTTDSNVPAWKDYGGRGITTCPRWRKFVNFLADMGACPEGLTIDRINNNGNYEPGNCRWTDMKTQANNTRHNVIINVNGVKLSLKQACAVLGANYGTVRNALWQSRKESL